MCSENTSANFKSSLIKRKSLHKNMTMKGPEEGNSMIISSKR